MRNLFVMRDASVLKSSDHVKIVTALDKFILQLSLYVRPTVSKHLDRDRVEEIVFQFPKKTIHLTIS